MYNMSYSKLIKGQRYLFYLETSPNNSHTFRANFNEILNKKTIKVTKLVEPGKLVFDSDKSCIWYIPLDWITKIETLHDLTYEKTIFPEEILLEIDNFN